MEFYYKNSCLIKEENILKTAEETRPYLEHLRTVAQISSYDFPESSINLPFDGDILRSVLNIKKEKVSDDLKLMIIIGIGGSKLGTKAVYDAIYGYFNFFNDKNSQQVIFLDTNDVEFMSKLVDLLKNKISKPSEVLINVISKSGDTLEVIVNFETIYNVLKEKFSDINNRIVVITQKNSKLWEAAEKNNLSFLVIPEKVGGRFSLFSSVGIFPLSVIGIDAEELLKGAREARADCLNEKILKNSAMLSAIIIFLNFKNGKTINDNFLFHPELESLGKWYRQLMAESLGKERDINNKKINIGITPTVSIGLADLHSMAQLYLGGPSDKFTTFVWAKTSQELKTPESFVFSDSAKVIENKSIGSTMENIIEGVKNAYKKKKLPFVEIVLPDISAYSLGYFMQFKMIEIMFLANLFNVNAFSQPNVEEYKEEVKQLFL
jgi:glucose-6-phosphate isomerase